MVSRGNCKPTMDHSSLPICLRSCCSTSESSTLLRPFTRRRQMDKSFTKKRPWSQDCDVVVQIIDSTGTNTCNHWRTRSTRQWTNQQTLTKTASFYQARVTCYQLLYQGKIPLWRLLQAFALCHATLPTRTNGEHGKRHWQIAGSRMGRQRTSLRQ